MLPEPTNYGDQKRAIYERWAEFHNANPQVYLELVRLAREAKDQGHAKVGIRMLWEVMRWNLTVKTKSADDFKLNDHYTSRYARFIMHHEKDLNDIFEVRELRAE